MKYLRMASPMKIGEVEIKNRTIMTAMGVAMANMDGTVTDKMIAYYAERAKGGVGLIIPEFTKVNDMGPGTLYQMSLTRDEHIASVHKLVEAVHAYGTKIFIQLHHAGRQTYSALINGEPVVAPSAIPCGFCQQETRALETEEVKQIIQNFIQSACRAKAAGADGVEIHAAHGYLLNQFLSPNVNKRQDEYGGSVENRSRIVCEIIEGVKKECGKGFAVSVRITAEEFLEFIGKPGEGIKLDMAVEMSKLFEKSGADVINATCGTYETIVTFMEPGFYQEGWRLYLAETIKKAVHIPVFGNAVIRNPEFAEKILEEGSVDFISMGRSYLADSNWVNKAFQGREKEIRKCISCLRCAETFNASSVTHKSLECSLNARLGRELEYPMPPAQVGNGRTIVIVGAGPAGLEAARVLAMRNFKPIIFEAAEEIGGQLRYAKKPPHKERIDGLIQYYRYELELLGVKILLNTTATVEEIKKYAPYGVIVATGSQPMIPRSISGIDGANVHIITDILSGKDELREKNICIIGSGMTGLETAEMLAEQGNKVTVVEMAKTVAPGAFVMNVIDVTMRLNQYGVTMMLGHKLTQIKENAIVLENLAGEVKEVETDAVVLSLGVTCDSKFYENNKEAFDNMWNIGDSEKIGRIGEAVSAGFELGYSIT